MGTEHILIIAIASTVASILYSLAAGAFGGDAVEGLEGPGEGGGWSILQFISLQAILVATMSLSWSLLYWQGKDITLAMQIIATLLSGGAMIWLYLGGMKLIGRLNSPSRLQGFTPRVGMGGVVYSRVPGGGESTGIVTFFDPALGDMHLDAITMTDLDIDNGTDVIVTQVDSNRVVVRPVCVAN
jgi:hypothetical protein